jgi:hypothetical protein
MAKLTPRDFSHIPYGYRPQRNIVVDKDFAEKVKSIEKYGVRSNSEEVGDVMMVLNNMRQFRPNLFTKARKQTGGGKRSGKRRTKRRQTQRRDRH